MFFDRHSMRALDLRPVYTVNCVVRPLAEEFEVELSATFRARRRVWAEPPR
jgi:hypothetical protein